MKRLLMVSALAVGLASPFAVAQFKDPSTVMINNSQGGFQGPSAVDNVTISDAKTMRDDSYIALEGKITKHLRKDKYLFTDGTDEIVVEIDKDKWRGVIITPNDTVRLEGEIDAGRGGKVEIDVDRIQLAK
ncbi:MAG: NirD/YgiW/YdeI family stress tolerance protein [Xanthomonadaceae bacterium]|nr:NirD/YgiW/YdeI family stress tolerance protein [Xanthomonadaceae bacterium]